MIKKGINASFHEFTGGHNYGCWRNSLIERFKELCETRFVYNKNTEDLPEKLIRKPPF